MKKILSLAIATLALSACTDVTEQVGISAKRVPITVDVYTQGQVRAYTETTASVLQEEGFYLNITSGTGEGAINETVDVTYADGKYSLSKEIFWPTSDEQTVNFLAYYGGTLSSGKIIPTAETDAVFSTFSGTLKDNATGVVSLSFSHIMSDVSINVKSDHGTPAGSENSDGVTVTLKSFTVSGEGLDVCVPTNKATWESSVEETPTKDFFTLSSNQPVTTESSALFANMLLPQQTYTISATYEVTSPVSNTPTEFTKTGEFEVTTAGSKYEINVTLPTSLQSASVSIREVSPWSEASTSEKTLE